MSTFQFVASLVSSLAWPVAVIAAVFILRKPLASAFGRVRKIEALGVSAELDEVEQARENVEQELSNPDRDVDELVERAAEFGWRLGRAAPDVPPQVQVDRSSDTPVVHSASEDALRRWAARMNDSNGYVWEHLVAQLEELITSGHFKPGQAFPSALRISRDFQVGLGTARKALRVLERQGRIVVVPSKGSFVTPQVPEFKMPGPPADA